MDLYNILGIKNTASKEDIKKAYRKASLKHHPDRGGNAEEFKKVNRAYEVLSDPMKKRDYDFKKNNNFYGGGNTNIFSDVDQQDSIPDLFKMFFGGMPMGVNPEMFGNVEKGGNFFGSPNFRVYKNGHEVFSNMNTKPAAITKNIEIDLEAAYQGVYYPIEIER